MIDLCFKLYIMFVFFLNSVFIIVNLLKILLLSQIFFINSYETLKTKNIKL